MPLLENPVIANPGEEKSGSVSTLDLSACGQCLNGVADVFTGLSLEGFPPERIHIRRNGFIDPEKDVLPCAVISHYAIRPDNAGGSNRENAVHYLILLTLHWAGGRDAINGEGLALNALEQTYVAFSKKPQRNSGFEVNANGAMLKQTTIDSAEALNEEAFRRGINAMFLILDCSVRLPYGDVA